MARGHLFPFVPVFLGAGVGVYFAGAEEPSGGLLLGVALAGSLLMGTALRGPELARPVFLALSLMALGFGAAGLRTQMVEAPVLGWQRYGPIEGRIVAVDRSASGAVRLTLDRVVLAGLEPERTPARVRISLHGGPLDVAPIAGTRVMMTGHLAPPSGPTEPGGFDFRRHAWFARLGAVGYTRAPVVAWSGPEAGLIPGIAAGIGLALTRLRHRMSAGIPGMRAVR
ncbi:DUF4131 domain-containing protein, partial [Pararhodobacter oceanensis]|uniref:DUF4131 domain-containing protein n=1 Tax=Pararhodobacter oceanensis TaxID=2172121 RepID=UPI003A8D5D20